MSKSGLISEKIITLQRPNPIKGIILIEGERIFDIIESPPEQSLQDLAQSYIDWNPTIYPDSYICPGIIDLSVRSEWDSLASVTKMAASGGVTLVCLEENLHGTSPDSLHLYSDTLKIGLIENISQDPPSGIIAYKGYLYPPSNKVKACINDLEHSIEILAKLNMPLFIDCMLPHERILNQASPCRHLTLTERINYDPENVDGSKFSAAFPDEIQKISSSDSEEDELDTDIVDMNINYPESSSKYNRRNSEQWGIDRKGSCNSVYEELDKKIKKNQDDLVNLSLLEEMSYKMSGVTVTETRIRSSSCNDEIFVKNEESPNNSFNDRINTRRPSALNLQPVRAVREDTIYLNFLAKVPESWENNGVKLISSILSSTSLHVHFTKLSSASSINIIRKLNSKNFTCDTSSHHLFLADCQIPDCESNFKDFPPIRSTLNQEIMWQLLKLGDIQTIASHHASIPAGLKKMSGGSFLQSLSGVNSLGFSLQMIWTKVKEMEDGENFDEKIEKIFSWMALNPALVLKVEHKMGSLAPGKYANVVIWKPFEESLRKSWTEAGRCLFEQERLYGRVEKTIVRGNVVWDGKFYPVGGN